MCGIAGIISANTNRINEEVLIHMGDALAHRGPDGAANWISSKGHAGFVHRRLSIIALSEKVSQPMHFGERFTIVYNGKIYNYL